MYAPTSARTEAEGEIVDFYSDLEDEYAKCGSQDIGFVIGGMNAKVGSEQDTLKEIVEGHGLRERNERGDLWLDHKRKHRTPPTSKGHGSG